MTDKIQQDDFDSKWKQKYFDHLDQSDAIEKQLRARANAVAEGLIAFCDFSNNISEKLFNACKPVRYIAHKNVFDAKLPQKLNNLKQALNGLENETLAARNSAINAIKSSIELLLASESTAGTQRELRKLKNSLNTTETDETLLVENVLKFNQLLQTILAELKPGENRKNPPLTNKQASANDLNNMDQEPIVEQYSETSDSYTNRGNSKPSESESTVIKMPQTKITQYNNHEKIAAILLHLLNQLDIPDALVEDSKQLKSRLQQELDWTTLESLMMPSIELTLSTIEWHYTHFGDFIEQINSQLDAVQAFLQATQQSRNEHISNHNQLNDSMCKAVTDIEAGIEESDNLKHLKQTISQKMGNIVNALAEYEESEHTRESQLVNELEELGDKLQEMEFHSIKMRAKLESQKQIARRDSVTQLPNRATYEERMEFEFSRWQRYNSQFALLLGDIDNFKQINDNYGHLAGDKVLKLVAQTIESSIRETDFVARYGGEEFVILLPNTSINEAIHVAEKLRSTIANCSFHRRGEQVPVTISFGIGEVAENDSLEMVFERTDSALYKAKELGRNRCCAAEVIN